MNHEDTKTRRLFNPITLGVFVTLWFCLLAAPLAAHAEPVEYSPEYCEFSATFPEEPEEIERCETTGDKECYRQISYTKVFALDSSVTLKVICNPSDEAIHKAYNDEVMRMTLRAMTNRDVIETYDISFREEEEEGYKQAGLIGQGQKGMDATLYIAQLWIGQKSAMSVEAELIGEPSEEADQLFSELLRSVKFVGLEGKMPAEPPPEKEPSQAEKAP